MAIWGSMAGKIRRWVLGDLESVVERMRGEIDGLRRALDDPATIQPLVAAALRGEVRSSPDEIAAALAPLVDRLVRQHAREMRVRRISPPIRWLWPAAAVLLLALAGTGLWSRNAGVSEATVAAPAAGAAAVSRAVVVEQRQDGFGLGGAGVNDQELADGVRARLGACPELVGASVSFSVAEGWVWLRGEASAEGRAAAARALADLRSGVFVVNQIAAPRTESGGAG